MVELVIAMMILGVILVLLAAVQISALTTVNEARKLQQATAFANEAVEQMRAIPWNTLSKGMYSGFLAASGGDELVSSGILNVDDRSVGLIIAPTVDDQDISDPVRPIFDGTGSNVQTLRDPSLTGVEFTVKAYVTESRGGASAYIVGIAVVVEWPNRYGGVSRTTVWSEAYRGSEGSCGDPDTQPFLAACQSFFEATSTTGNVSAEVSASNVDPDPLNVFPQPLLYPLSDPEYSLGMRSAGAAASMSSQQVNFADGIIQFGGNTVDDGSVDTPADQKGFAVHSVRATDDVTNQNGWLPTATDAWTQGAIAEGEKWVRHIPDSPIRLRARSDFARPGTAYASMTESCMIGIPDDQPCALASLGNDSVLLTGSGYLLMEWDDGTIFRLSRRLSDETPGNVESAWAARFISVTGSTAVGCTTITGAGCVSAGATRTMAPLNIGKVTNNGGTWNGDAANGMVILTGDSARCPASQGVYYGESVMAQRGPSQTTAAPNVTRCGELQYWDGSGYTPVDIDNSDEPTIDTAPVTWTSGTRTVVGTTQIQILPVYIDNPLPADASCRDSACTVSVSAGTILMVSTYDISWVDGTGTTQEYVLIVATTVTSPSAQASYKAAPHAS